MIFKPEELNLTGQQQPRGTEIKIVLWGSFQDEPMRSFNEI